mmetsp:Transcript_14619/g.47971  ORF Transcript_14619/g.47971 Transcript_14619/m.47971 type:complete len:376 (-) Transcript_14619:1795-2922(-)
MCVSVRCDVEGGGRSESFSPIVKGSFALSVCELSPRRLIDSGGGEARGVLTVEQARDPRRLEGAITQQRPLQRRKPRVLDDVGGAAHKDAEPLRRDNLKEALDEIERLLRALSRKLELHLGERLKLLHPEVRELGFRERWVAGEHLIHEDAERPPIDADGVSYFFHHLRSHVIGRAHEREGFLARPQLLGKAKVAERDVPRVMRHEQVLELEVAVADVAAVQKLQGEHEIRYVEFTVALRKDAAGQVSLHACVQVPAHQRLEEHVNEVFVAARRDQLDDERAIGALAHAVALPRHEVDDVLFQKVRLAHLFPRKELILVCATTPSRQLHRPKSAGAEHLDYAHLARLYVLHHERPRLERLGERLQRTEHLLNRPS